MDFSIPELAPFGSKGSTATNHLGDYRIIRRFTDLPNLQLLGEMLFFATNRHVFCLFLGCASKKNQKLSGDSHFWALVQWTPHLLYQVQYVTEIAGTSQVSIVWLQSFKIGLQMQHLSAMLDPWFKVDEWKSRRFLEYTRWKYFMSSSATLENYHWYCIKQIPYKDTYQKIPLHRHK